MPDVPYMLGLILLAAFILFSAAPIYSSTAAVEKLILKGNVTDVEGEAVRGAEIYIYDSPDTRRPADFISARTGISGGFSISLAAGRYWAVVT